MSALRVGLSAISIAFGLSLTSVSLPSQNLEPAINGSLPDVRQDEVTGRSPKEHLKKELLLAEDYLAGRGVPRDPALSFYWYRKAADQGDPGAQTQLGYFYSRGIGVQADQTESAKWFGRAMAGGSSMAKLNLAVMYLKGMGVPRDPQMALELLKELAERNDPGGESYLGLVYYMGDGVKVDHSTAEKWFLRAAKQHNPDAEYDMGTLYSVASDHVHNFPKAAEYLKSAAHSGYVPAMNSLGLLLVNHPELPQAPDEAVATLQTAAEAGAWRSSAILGVLSRDGRGVPRDSELSCVWFRIAVMQGGPDAQKLVGADLAKCATSPPSLRAEENQRSVDWLELHPHANLYIYGDKLQKEQFPIAEIPILDLAQSN